MVPVAELFCGNVVTGACATVRITVSSGSTVVSAVGSTVTVAVELPATFNRAVGRRKRGRACLGVVSVEGGGPADREVRGQRAGGYAGAREGVTKFPAPSSSVEAGATATDTSVSSFVTVPVAELGSPTV